jgi:hypothetical protein
LGYGDDAQEVADLDVGQGVDAGEVGVLEGDFAVAVGVFFDVGAAGLEGYAVEADVLGDVAAPAAAVEAVLVVQGYAVGGRERDADGVAVGAGDALRIEGGVGQRDAEGGGWVDVE